MTEYVCPEPVLAKKNVFESNQLNCPKRRFPHQRSHPSQAENVPLFQVFRMLVPSLSWQMFEF